ncbi:MAG: hypothetical protein JST36_09110 [Bacteroidetes bacterium]|nr:hypothetical protein [Bacteroidota bacterium]
MSLLGAWRAKLEEYAQLRISLVKLSLIERSAKLMGAIMFGFIIMCLGFGVLAFMGFGLMQVLTQAFDSAIAGAFCMAGIFLLLVGLVVLSRKNIVARIAALFISVLTADDDDFNDKRSENKEP